jgi:NADPH:quinone reductase-like Zn-dependent oxidoreductase
MKAVRFNEYGDESVLRYEDVDRPIPGIGQVLVQVAATSFNPIDVGIRAGFLQPIFPVELPHTPGIDVAGTVAETGESVAQFKVGDHVIGFLPMTENGAAADYVLAPADALVAAPTSIPLVEAAAVPAATLTAWQALFEHADLKSGQRVIINGAGGGVGSFAVQLATKAGAFVIATASPRSTAAVKGHGANQVVDYTTTSVTEAVTQPVDVVLNLVMSSEPEMAALVGLVKPGGVLITTGSAARPDPERDVHAESMALHSDTGQLSQMVARIDAGQLVVDVSASYPLSQTATVHERGAAGELRGKVLLIPGS